LAVWPDLFGRALLARQWGRIGAQGPRPNSRVTRGHLGSVDGQPCLHVEFEAAVRVHVLPDQRRQGTEISDGELS
jgi:hypothetical protein